MRKRSASSRLKTRYCDQAECYSFIDLRESHPKSAEQINGQKPWPWALPCRDVCWLLRSTHFHSADADWLAGSKPFASAYVPVRELRLSPGYSVCATKAGYTSLRT